LRGGAWRKSLSPQPVRPLPDHLFPLPVLDHHLHHLLRRPHCQVFLHCSGTKKPNFDSLGIASSGSASLLPQSVSPLLSWWRIPEQCSVEVWRLQDGDEKELEVNLPRQGITIVEDSLCQAFGISLVNAQTSTLQSRPLWRNNLSL